MDPPFQEKYRYEPNPDCENCDGTGIFAEEGYDESVEEEVCIFCLEDAILSGVIDGCIDGTDYTNGKAQPRETRTSQDNRE